MKKTVNKLALAGVIMFGLSQVNAQRSMRYLSKDKIKEFKSMKMDRFKNNLDLSENQVNDIENIFTKYESQEKALNDQIKAKKLNRESIKNDINNILTPEQRKKMEVLHTKRKNKSSDKKEIKIINHSYSGIDLDKRMNKLKNYLDLSDEQVSQIKAVKEKHKPTQAEKDTRKSIMKEKKSLREQKMNEVKQVLNIDQKTKFEAMQNKMKKRSNLR